MNSLSLLIYAVELIANIGTLATSLLVIGIIVFLFTSLCWFIIQNCKGEHGYEQWNGIWSWFIPRAFAAIVIATLLLVFIPNRQTTIMIAASEVAEVVVKTEEAKEVMAGAKGALKEVSGLSSDAVGLLKQYIQNETQKLVEEATPPKKAEETK